MEFEDMGRVWREEGTGEFRRTRIEDLSSARGRAARHLNTMARRGYRFGAVLLLVIVPWFGWAVIVGPRPFVAGPGAALLWGWLIHIILFLRRLGRSEPDPTLPMRVGMAVELERLKTLERFRETLEWSLVAFIVGELLFFVGMSRGLAEDWVSIVLFSVVVLVVAGMGVLGNRRILRRVVRPLRKELESWISDLEKLNLDGGEGESGLSTHATSSVIDGDLKGDRI